MALVHPNARGPGGWRAIALSNPAHAVALQYLGLVPLIDFNFRRRYGSVDGGASDPRGHKRYLRKWLLSRMQVVSDKSEMALALLWHIHIHSGEARCHGDARAVPLCARAHADCVVDCFGRRSPYRADSFTITDSRVLMAIAIVASEVYFTGSLHADGVADTADGFSAARKTDREHGLAAMKDPRIGAIGTLALLFTYGSQIAMVTFLANPLVLDSGWNYRARIRHYLCSSGTPSARRDGIGLAFIGAINTRWLAVNTTISLLLLWGAFALLPLRFGPILVTVAILVLVGLILNLFKRRSIRRLGGLTGTY